MKKILKKILPEQVKPVFSLFYNEFVRFVCLFIWKYRQHLEKRNNKSLNIRSVDEMISNITQKNVSMARFGDGELTLLLEKTGPKFQEVDKRLAKRLLEVLQSKSDKCMICLPPTLMVMGPYTHSCKKYWSRYYCNNYINFKCFLDMNRFYYNSFISRPYITMKDKSKCKKSFEQLKTIWNKKDLLIVEGEYSRLGIGNDLFSNASSICRVLCPAENAFRRYEEILAFLRTQSQKYLIVLALGPTATVLAYDLSELGYQALDIGHIDIEYEWFLKKTKKKVSIAHKYTNEVVTGNLANEFVDESYNKQIIGKIL